jgi:hypothetical protein
MAWLRRVVETRGVPVAVYVDRHGIFQRRTHEPLTLEEELAGGPLPTQLGRVFEELGIRVIHALSPQAKGRVERLFGTLQDRLVAELRLAGLHAGSGMDEADRVLADYLPRFNARFAVPASATESAYRPLTEALPAGVTLDQVCCFKYERIVGLDNTVRVQERRLQLGPGSHRRSYAKARVEVHERLDGSLAVYHGGHLLAATPAPAEAPVLRARRLPRPPRTPRAAPAPRPDAADAADAATADAADAAATAATADTAPSQPAPPTALAPAPAAPHPWGRKGYFAKDGPLPFRRTATGQPVNVAEQ